MAEPCDTATCVPTSASICGRLADRVLMLSESSKLMPLFSSIQDSTTPKSVEPVSARPIFGAEVASTMRDSLGEYSFSDQAEASNSQASVSDAQVPDTRVDAISPVVAHVTAGTLRMPQLSLSQFHAATVSQSVWLKEGNTTQTSLFCGFRQRKARCACADSMESNNHLRMRPSAMLTASPPL